MLECAQKRIKFQFVSGVVALGTAEGLGEKANWVLQAGIFNRLYKHRSEVDGTSVSFK